MVWNSRGTPPAARTATTQAVGADPGNVFGQGKSAPLIAMAHEIPYVATATVAALFGLECAVYMGEEDTQRQALNVARMRLLGAERPSFDTIVASGPNSAMPHYSAGERTLVDGDLRLTDHDETKWVTPAEAASLNWAPADIPAVEALASTHN